MIGETLYLYDGNSRVYQNDDGTPRRSPNPRHYWRAMEVVGETRDSWVLGGGIKVNKATMELRGSVGVAFKRHAYTHAQMEDELWRDIHGYKVMDLVKQADTPTLRKIAELLGYDLA